MEKKVSERLSYEVKFFTKRTIVIIIFLEVISLYIPVIPSVESSGILDVNNIGLSYIKNSFLYYSNWFLVVSIILLIPILFLIIIQSDILSEKYYIKSKEIYNNLIKIGIKSLDIFKKLYFLFDFYSFSCYHIVYFFCYFTCMISASFQISGNHCIIHSLFDFFIVFHHIA